MKTSLKDIAEELHLSKTTVSWVLSGQGDEKAISKKTQKRITDYAKLMKYQPNLLARSLNTGISKTVAKNIVKYREENGKFTDRKQLLNVDKLGPKAFLQCAGFTRIMDGKNPLDATSVHPESYEAVNKLLKKLGLSMQQLRES